MWDTNMSTEIKDEPNIGDGNVDIDVKYDIKDIKEEQNYGNLICISVYYRL